MVRKSRKRMQGQQCRCLLDWSSLHHRLHLAPHRLDSDPPQQNAESWRVSSCLHNIVCCIRADLQSSTVDPPALGGDAQRVLQYAAGSGEAVIEDSHVLLKVASWIGRASLGRPHQPQPNMAQVPTLVQKAGEMVAGHQGHLSGGLCQDES